jgi:hypothetical protein
VAETASSGIFEQQVKSWFVCTNQQKIAGDVFTNIVYYMRTQHNLLWVKVLLKNKNPNWCCDRRSRDSSRTHVSTRKGFNFTGEAAHEKRTKTPTTLPR